MKGVDIDAALLEFGGAVARFRSLAHGTRRPHRSRWRKWWLCRERIARCEREAHLSYRMWMHMQDQWIALARYYANEEPPHAKWAMQEKRKHFARTQAAERYRRMLWGRKPFGKGKKG